MGTQLAHELGYEQNFGFQPEMKGTVLIAIQKPTFEPGFEMLFELLEEPLLLLQSDGTLVAVNQTATQFLCKSARELVGSRFDDVFFPWAELGEIQGAQHAVTRQLTLAGRKKSRFSLRFYGLPDQRWLMYVKDEDANWQIEVERERLLAMASLTDILPTFLHELKNPLASIMAVAELSLEDLPPGEARESMEAVLQESARMKLAFEGLGNLSRNLRCQDEQDIATAIYDACQIFRPLFERLQIHLKVDLEPMPRLPLQVAGIRGMLFNLLNNAKQACHSGDRVRVEGHVDHDQGVFQFSISDTGVGMSPEVAASCTELFYTTKPMGSGVGMALCRAALTQLNGTLNIASEPGKGTRVTATIPLSDTDERRSVYEPHRTNQ
jgi:signal transduction histidine kinase